MNSTVLVNNLGKAYKHYPSKLSRLKEWLIPFHKKDQHHLNWTIRNVSFEAKAGEALGLIGVNGAGKSTLLKIITGTTTATEGQVQTKGRIAALLELGMGFHPDFTGRQNAFMSGQLLGLTHNEIERLMPSIIEFAEIGDYIDQPVRVYSSGMQVRLAFSVATALRPDILIVDEALSVGDAYFQHKSFDRIKQFKQEGTTLLIVSHDKQAILNICDKVILLAKGRKVMEGDPEEVFNYYNALLAGDEDKIVKVKPLEVSPDERPQKGLKNKERITSGSKEALFSMIKLTDLEGNELDTVYVGQKLRLNIQIEAQSDLPSLVIGYAIKDKFGRDIFGTNTFHLNKTSENISKGEILNYRFIFDANIGEGNYSITVAAHMGQTHIEKNYEWRDLAVIFNVVNTQFNTFIGSSWIPAEVECLR